MKIPRDDFLRKYKQLFLDGTPGIAVFAYWKVKYLIENGECFYLPDYDCWYMIRDGHFLVYYSPDNLMHIPAEELNGLECISLPAAMYDSIKERLTGFNVSYDWGLRYDFCYRPRERDAQRYEAVDFDFSGRRHYRKAAEIIGGLKAKNIRKMTTYTAFDASLWFFVREKGTGELAAISISAYDAEVRQTDLDWIAVAPEFQGRGCGRFLIGETIRRCKGKSDSICVGGAVAFYRKCGFTDYELWAWAAKEGYRFRAEGIQP